MSRPLSNAMFRSPRSDSQRVQSRSGSGAVEAAWPVIFRPEMNPTERGGKQMQVVRTWKRHQRRATVIAQVAVMSTVMMGFAALSLDIGSMYVVKSELQAVADAAALAAASQLSALDNEDPEQLARDRAQEFASQNKANGSYVGVDTSNDVEFGTSSYDANTDKFEFVSGGMPRDAVKVTARRDSNFGGPVDFYFAKIFGMSGKNMEASAVATLIPRDIVVVIDLSRSMLYDSQLRYYNRTDGGYANLRDVWAALDGPEPSRPYYPGHESGTEYSGDTGPTAGYMTEWGDPLDSDYSPSSDPGLYYIPNRDEKSGVTDSRLVSKLAARGYSPEEINALANGSQDRYDDSYRHRVAVLLGLAEWHSGKVGGKYYGNNVGNGNDYIGTSEVKSWAPVDQSTLGNMSWSSYIAQVHSKGASKSGSFKYRYGLKTLTDYLMEKRSPHNKTPSLAYTPEQPVRAVKDAVQELSDYLVQLQSPDQMGLAIYGTTTRLEVQLTEMLNTIPERLYGMQAGHYNSSTNIGGGIAEAYAELKSARARGAARKTIVLMSDGVANIDEFGNYNISGAKGYAQQQSEIAGQDDVTIHTVSVGYGVDRALMQEIAQNGNGLEFYAAGSPEEYTEELRQIFKALGSKRPVVLIE